MLELLAQAVPIPTEGSGPGLAIAGWSSAGMLMMVLWWLFRFHLPSKDKQIGEFVQQFNTFVESKDAQISNLIASKDAQFAELSKRHAETIKEIVARNEAGLSKLTETLEEMDANHRKEMREEAEINRKSRHDANNQLMTCISQLRETVTMQQHGRRDV